MEAPLAEVVMLQWPAEESRRERLASERVPRLLLVDPTAPPPVSADEREDWVRLPAPDVDIRAKVRGLAARTEGPPKLDADGVLRCNGGWVSLPPVEARIAGALIERYGAVVSRQALGEAGWPDEGVPGRNALDVHVLRIRRRIEGVGLAIRTVRSRGYLLERASDFGKTSVRVP